MLMLGAMVVMVVMVVLLLMLLMVLCVDQTTIRPEAIITSTGRGTERSAWKPF